MKNLKKLFEKHEDESCEFDRITHPISQRPEICGFLLLDKLVPQKGSLIDFTDGHEIKLDVDLKKLNEVITEGDVITLLRCGIDYNPDEKHLYMFVS